MPYHVPPEIAFLVLLETLEILQNSRTGILDILLRYPQCLFQLEMTGLAKNALSVTPNPHIPHIPE